MGCLKHAYNHFNTHETLHHDTIFNHRIDRLPYRYVSQIPSLCLCYVCACTCLHNVCVCVDTIVYIYTQVTRVCQDIPHHMSGTFNKHSSLAIYDKHLVRQTNQGWPKILPQYPLETALTVT